MRKILKTLKASYKRTLRSIALYPVVISVLFLLFSIGIPQLETSSFVTYLKDKIPYLLIDNIDTARTTLSTLIGGILSLTVFSFSMVMVVLNQASSNYSPRLLPGLISDKKHQMILGVYIGTLLYALVALITMDAADSDSSKEIIGLTTMFAAIFGIICVGLFVYFIHTISNAIQIHEITDRIARESERYVNQKCEEPEAEIRVTDLWKTIISHRTGYYRGFDMGIFNNSLQHLENYVHVIPYQDQHVWEGHPLLKIKQEVSDDDLERIQDCLIFSKDRHEDNTYIGGMIKLMEVAVKAMSPGINDPGTAIEIITRLGLLLYKTIKISTYTQTKSNSEKCTIIQSNITTTEVLRLIIQPLRRYAKHDNLVMHELILMLHYILQTDIALHEKIPVKAELDATKEDIEAHITNTADQKQIFKLLD